MRKGEKNTVRGCRYRKPKPEYTDDGARPGSESPRYCRLSGGIGKAENFCSAISACGPNCSMRHKT